MIKGLKLRAVSKSGRTRKEEHDEKKLGSARGTQDCRLGVRPTISAVQHGFSLVFLQGNDFNSCAKISAHRRRKKKFTCVPAA
jgi:hypothetical protein